MAAVAAIALLAAAVPRGGSAPAVDATHQGVIQPGPLSAAIIQGHRIILPIQMATCSTTTGTANNSCRLGAYEVKLQWDSTRFTQTSDLGTSTDADSGNTNGSNTSTTLVDVTKNWVPDQWVGQKIVLRSGPGATGADGNLQYRNIAANTSNTLTINPPWDGAVLPNDLTKYAIGGAGVSSGGNTSTTLRDLVPGWKVNQWVGSRVTLLGGPGYTGADGNPQSRIVVSNSTTTLTVSPPWDGGAIPLPGNTTRYMLGAMVDGGFLGSTGRSILCPNDPVITGNTADLACISLGNGPPWGSNGTGNLTTLSLRANSTTVGTTPCGTPGAWTPCFPRGVSSISLITPETQALRIDGFDIFADVLSGTRRIIVCPDANPTPDGQVNSIDLALIAQQFFKAPGQTGYTVTRDPDENGLVSSIDLSLTAQVFGKTCNQ